MKSAQARRWAAEEFGGAELGDARLTQRLVRFATQVALRPRGTVSASVRGAAAREGAFRWLENDRVELSAVARSCHRATVQRCARQATVLVAVDQSTVSVTDHRQRKGLGPTSNKRSQRYRGLEVMSALAVDADHRALGLVAQQWWCRSDAPSPTFSADRRPAELRESELWHRTLKQAVERFAESGTQTRPWFQLDRGGDFWRVFHLADERQLLVTVRSAYDRTLAKGARLHQVVRRLPVAGRLGLQLPARRPVDAPPQRPQRRTVDIRFAPVPLLLTDYHQRRFTVTVNAVYLRQRRPRRRQQRLEWLLLTTHPVDTLEQAKLVLASYTTRWRVEEFHRTWKSGACNVERSQLRSRQAFCRWATLLAAVAARVERLKRLARTTPDVPALTELSQLEIDAAIVLSETRKYRPGAKLTLAEAVTIIAEAGGYTGKSSGGPPGSITIGRGLQEVMAAVRVIEAMQSRS